MGTKLSDRDVHALMAFAGRRLQNLHLGTSIIEGIYCLRCNSQHFDCATCAQRCKAPCQSTSLLLATETHSSDKVLMSQAGLGPCNLENAGKFSCT